MGNWVAFADTCFVALDRLSSWYRCLTPREPAGGDLTLQHVQTSRANHLGAQKLWSMRGVCEKEPTPTAEQKKRDRGRFRRSQQTACNKTHSRASTRSQQSTMPQGGARSVQQPPQLERACSRRRAQPAVAKPQYHANKAPLSRGATRIALL